LNCKTKLNKQTNQKKQKTKHKIKQNNNFRAFYQEKKKKKKQDRKLVILGSVTIDVINLAM
jgi:sortase (surface protein transpeptidase)